MHVHSIYVHNGACVVCVLYVPVQLYPLPSKPSLHVQLKLPSVSVQLALGSHVCTSSSHSLTSAECTQVDKYVCIDITKIHIPLCLSLAQVT